MANQDLRFRRRVTTVGDAQPKKNLPVVFAAAASALVILPALIYTAVHPTVVSSTVRSFTKHVPVSIKDIGRVAIVASRTTPTPQPTLTPTPAASATPAQQTPSKLQAAQLAHLAHLKRAHELALAATHAKKLASNGETSDISSSTAASSEPAAVPTAQPLTQTAGLSSPVADQPVADATPVYAPDMVVDARFTKEVQPDYPEVAKEQGASGTAVVLATIGPSGNVLSTRIDQSTGNKLLDEAALTAARDSSFEPPKINGKLATETYRLVYTFSI